METVIIEKPSENRIAQKNKHYIAKGYKRRVYEVHAPCQWLTDCDNGKCPALLRIAGNYYCSRAEVT